MRPLEFFLLLANVLTVLALLFPLPKPVRWMPQLALVLAGAQRQNLFSPDVRAAGWRKTSSRSK